ncbi:MAG: MaoC family dehydratase N-terminal domain-containing protein [SAR202 cluster bacterium]|nr:MaoC family dehydratase N-terminal domain-containing protein [SAR202 cluster bacterium]
MGESLIIDQMRAAIGKPLGGTYVAGAVDRSALQKFATAVSDTNPLWVDDEYGKGTHWGSSIAPPTFMISITPQSTMTDGHSPTLEEASLPFERPFKLGFAAGDEWESFKPVRPGDVLTVTTILGDIWEKQGRPGIGRMLFVRVDNTIRNQRNEVVSIHRYTQVNYEGPTE